MSNAVIKWTGDIVDQDLFKHYFLPPEASRLAVGSQALDLNWLRVFARKHQNIPAEQFIDFLYQAQRQGADPRNKEVYLVVRNAYNRDTKGFEPTATTVFAYQFFISRAMATGRIAKWEVGTIVEEYYNPVTNHKGPALTAVARVWMKDQTEPLVYRARFWEFAQKGKDGVVKSWAEKPYLMLEKCAIANAMRWACPEILSGVYIGEEIDSEQSRAIEMERKDPGVLPASTAEYRDYTDPSKAPPKPAAIPVARNAAPPPAPPAPPGAAHVGKPVASTAVIAPSVPSTPQDSTTSDSTTFHSEPVKTKAPPRVPRDSKELVDARVILGRWVDSVEKRKADPNVIADSDCQRLIKSGQLAEVKLATTTLAKWTQERMDAAKQEREAPSKGSEQRSREIEGVSLALRFASTRVIELGGAPMAIIGGNPHNIAESGDLTLMKECLDTLNAWRPKPRKAVKVEAMPDDGPLVSDILESYDMEDVPDIGETYDRAPFPPQPVVQSVPRATGVNIAVDPKIRFGLIEAVNRAAANGHVPANALTKLDPLLRDPAKADVVLQAMLVSDYSYFL